MATEPRHEQPSYIFFDQLLRHVIQQCQALEPGAWVHGWSGLWLRPNQEKLLDVRQVQIHDGHGYHFLVDNIFTNSVAIIGSNAGGATSWWLKDTYPDFLSFAADVANTINTAKGGEAHAG